MKYEKPGGMKKILFFLLLSFCIPYSIFGINGSGTYASPFYGPLTSNMNWGGTVYVNGDVVISDFTLTISTGTTVRFVSAGANIIITGNGVLIASGGSGSNMIRFTADFNNNGFFGESGETWGHISFQNMNTGFTTPSIINYCIIEYGQKNPSPLNVDASGGGIYTEFSYLTISNSIIRNNYAGFGGGIFVTQCSPHIFNCTFSNNTAGTTGGGLLFYINSPSLVENCVIYNNTSLGPGGAGGVFAGYEVGNLLFYNCVIASNISTYNYGDNIRLYVNTSPPFPKFQNCIIWGSNNWIQYVSSPVSASDFTNCALQGGASIYTNCININSNNTGTSPDGPNFNNPLGGDYSIAFKSPCRDMGLSTNAPNTDYLGNSRIGNYDIGAYEVQYSRWTGTTSTDWTVGINWEQAVTPSTGTGDVIIPGGLVNYPTLNPAPSFTIASGKFLIMEPASAATFNNLTNNGTIRFNSDASGIASLIMGRYQHTGTEEIQLFLPGGGGVGTYKWHYISSPVSSLATSVFTVTTPDLAEYDESLISNDQNNGWVGSDGWIYLPLPSHYGGPPFSSLAVGIGYNHYFGSDHTYTFSGLFNTGDVNNIPLAYNSGGGTAYPDAQGYNLLGNPFSSCLDWSQIVGGLNSSIGQAIYFNKSGQFASWVGGAGTNGGTATIPPMQGFFVKTNATGTTITLPASARAHNLSQTRYKKGLEIIPLVRLKLEDQTNNDDAVVRFDDKATTGVDNAFDAYKFSKSGLSIWTSSGKEDFSINGLPFPDTSIVIPVSVNSTAAGNLKITGSQIDGLDNYSVTLTDNVNNITIDLKTNPSLSFAAPGGIVEGRFVLKILNVITAVPETTISKKPFNIYSSNGAVNIQTLSDTWNGKSGGIKVLDMTGRIVATEDNVTFSKDELDQLPVSVATGIYMVEIRSGIMRYVGKIMIR
jgi:hypothetical protein